MITLPFLHLELERHSEDSSEVLRRIPNQSLWLGEKSVAKRGRNRHLSVAQRTREGKDFVSVLEHCRL